MATTIAHQERGGQFGGNRKSLGATLACANKIVFRRRLQIPESLRRSLPKSPSPSKSALFLKW